MRRRVQTNRTWLTFRNSRNVAFPMFLMFALKILQFSIVEKTHTFWKRERQQRIKRHTSMVQLWEHPSPDSVLPSSQNSGRYGGHGVYSIFFPSAKVHPSQVSSVLNIEQTAHARITLLEKRGNLIKRGILTHPHILKAQFCNEMSSRRNLRKSLCISAQ